MRSFWDENTVSRALPSNPNAEQSGAPSDQAYPSTIRDKVIL